MLIFALDSSGASGSAAIAKNGIIVSERFLNTGLTHSETLLCLCDGVFSDAGLSPYDMDYFAASSGPGSFTGLRIGIAAIKGMAFAAGKPCVGVPTLEAIAESVLFSDAVIVPVIDARRNRVYCAAFLRRLDGGSVRILKDDVLTLEQLRERCLEFHLPVLFAGDANKICSDFCNGAFTIVNSGQPCGFPRASAVAMKAMEYIGLGKTVSAGELTPFYMQQSQAERELISKNEDLDHGDT